MRVHTSHVRLCLAALLSLLPSLVCPAQSALKAPYGRDALLMTTARVTKLPEAEVPAASSAFVAKVKLRGVDFRMDAAAEREFRAEGATPEMLAAIRGAYRPGMTAPLSAGLLNGKTVSLPQPAYPPIARAARAQGTVVVEVVVDEQGAVVFADAASGHPLLWQAAVSAARQAKFTPFKVKGRPVTVAGIITYNFILQ
jgi:TonB family protein